jgi:pyruvate dehydrogenase kinase 2/3/4
MIIMRSIESLTPLFPSFPPPSLQIISMENYGTDAYLHLNRLGNVSEPLP